MEFRYQSGEEVKTVRIERDGALYKVWVGDKAYTVDVKDVSEAGVIFEVNGRYLQAYTAVDKGSRYIGFGATSYVLQKVEKGQRRKAANTGDNSLAAAMPGQVIKVLVNEGDTVKRGQTLVILEAMKMEIRVTAPDESSVVKVLCSVGEIVERGQRLIELAGA
jgi:3-methylcrotonyl-CoA carboxylase alpha subunit